MGKILELVVKFESANNQQPTKEKQINIVKFHFKNKKIIIKFKNKI